MNEMIERAAKAMAAKEGWRWDDDKQMLDRGGAGLQNSSRERDTWRGRARAAIEAMREPTEAMVGEAEAFEDQQSEQDIMNGGAGITYIADIYRVMIDAALPKD